MQYYLIIIVGYDVESTRLEARGYFGSAICCLIGSVDYFLTSPFKESSYEQGRTSNFLMECLEDTISSHANLVKNHFFFRKYNQINILIFPISLVKNDPKFSHLRHLNCDKHFGEVDACEIEKNIVGIRLVFDDEKIFKIFSESQDSSIVINLLKDILNKLNEIVPDKKINIIIKILEKSISNPPRYTFFSVKKEACFPELISSVKPESSNFKKARKRIAFLIKNIGIAEGEYKLDDAKEKINQIRDVIVAEINAEVNNFNFVESMPYLISRIDALANEDWRKRTKVKQGLNHSTDYEPEVLLSDNHLEYLKFHKNYRYLIEKFVQMSPQGKEVMNSDSFRNLIALIDWLHVFYLASDSLHYGIYPTGMKINSEFLPEVQYEESLSEKKINWQGNLQK